jgi:diadenosine tetraphosphate (Ap4A) HIT family hydrolase
MAQFRIHPQVLLDTHYLGKFPNCHVLLHKNAVLPWFILVPETNIADLLDLPDDLRGMTMREAAAISEFIKNQLGYEKVNFASIGNVVPQLHLHVVGRRPSDACWPAPVWGNLPETRDYSSPELRQLSERLQHHLGGEFVCAPNEGRFSAV